MKIYYIIVQLIIVSVFGYGHYLAGDDFARWMCVFIIGVGTIFNFKAYRMELHE